MSKSPLSRDTRLTLNLNAFALLTYVLLAMLGAVLLDWRLEKTALYDGLYDYSIVTRQIDRHDDWGDYIGSFTGQEIIDGHRAAHGSRYEDIRYPWVEANLTKTYMLVFAALLWLTPLSPRQWLVRRRRLLKNDRVDYGYAERLQDWLDENPQPFSAAWEKSQGRGVNLRPISLAFHTNSGMVTSYDNYGRARSKVVVDPFRLGFTLLGESEDGQVWRVVGFSTDSIRQFVVDTVEGWVGKVSSGSHLGAVLQAYSFGNYEPQAYAVLNQVVQDLDRGVPVAERTPINVQGAVLDQSGLMLAASVGRGNRWDVFLPVRFMRSLIEEIHDMTGRELPPADPTTLAISA